MFVNDACVWWNLVQFSKYSEVCQKKKKEKKCFLHSMFQCKWHVDNQRMVRGTCSLQTSVTQHSLPLEYMARFFALSLQQPLENFTGLVPYRVADVLNKKQTLQANDLAKQTQSQQFRRENRNYVKMSSIITGSTVCYLGFSLSKTHYI